MFNVLELAQLRSVIAVLFIFFNISYRYLCLVVFLLQLQTQVTLIISSSQSVFSKYPTIISVAY